MEGVIDNSKLAYCAFVEDLLGHFASVTGLLRCRASQTGAASICSRIQGLSWSIFITYASTLG